MSELQDFWKGIDLECDGGVEKLRCALICVACDLPAGRKACGFLSHNAKLGCTKCKKKFAGTVGSFDFSGFDRANWMESKNPRDQSEMLAKESESGCRNSVLNTLIPPHF